MVFVKYILPSATSIPFLWFQPLKWCVCLSQLANFCSKGSCSVQRCILGNGELGKQSRECFLQQLMMGAEAQDPSSMAPWQSLSSPTHRALPSAQSQEPFPLLSTLRWRNIKRSQLKTAALLFTQTHCLPCSPNQQSRPSARGQKWTFMEEITKYIKLSGRVSLKCPFLLM